MAPSGGENTAGPPGQLCRKCGKRVVNVSGQCSAVWSADEQKLADCLTHELARNVLETKTYEESQLGEVLFPTRFETARGRDGVSDRTKKTNVRDATRVILRWKTEGMSSSPVFYVMTHFTALRDYLEQHHDMKKASINDLHLIYSSVCWMLIQ
jgi:hypothetical protein